MFENHLFNLNAGAAEALKSIKDLKIFAVRLQQYEYTAKLREIEKSLQNAMEQIGDCRYPEPHKGLTPKGKLFYKHLFTYGAANNWQDLPNSFKILLLERKAHLNSTIEFNDQNTEELIHLNALLTGLENDTTEFYKYIQFVLGINGLKDHFESIIPQHIKLKCYTHSPFYEMPVTSLNSESFFYQFELPVSFFRNSIPEFYQEGSMAPDFLRTLPIKLRDEKFCLLFWLLATDGILSWEDFLIIDRIEIELPVNYVFSGTK